MARVVHVDGPDATDRPRFWGATFVGDAVLLRHWPILTPGEDCTERTPELVLTRAEWVARHAEFDLSLDGTPPT